MPRRTGPTNDRSALAGLYHRRSHAVILLAVYAIVIWYLTMRRRRTVMGFVIPIAGALLAAAVAMVLRLILDPVAYAQVSILLWADSVVVGVLGLYIACLPRRPKGLHCQRCRYDMTGLPAAAVCPECGAPFTVPPPRPRKAQDAARKADTPV